MNAIRFLRSVSIASALALVQCSGGSSERSPISAIPQNPSGPALRNMSLGGCTCSAYPDGTLAVWESASNHIYLYKGPISASSTPSATITTPTLNGDAQGGMTFDPSGNLWVSYFDTDATPAAREILKYAAPVTTGETPSATISGSNTGLSVPSGISYNQTTSKIYVLDPVAGKIDVWPSTSSGNVAPSATISSSHIGSAGIKTDASYIYITDATKGVDQFNLSASGSTSPNETFLTTAQRYWLDFDVEGNLYTNSSESIARFLYEDSWTNFTSFGAGSSSSPTVAVDDAGYIYVGDLSHIYIYNYSGSSPIVTLTVGSNISIVDTALYSPGRFNSAAPQ